MRTLIALDGSARATMILDEVARWLAAPGDSAELITVLDASELQGTAEFSVAQSEISPQGTESGTPLGLGLATPRMVKDRTQAIDRVEAATVARLGGLAKGRLDGVACTFRAIVAYDADATGVAAAIIDAAGDLAADAIVVGTHGRTGVERAVMGSVAEAVLRDALVPVLVVPNIR